MDGVLIDNGASSNTIALNLISGNNANGVNIIGAMDNTLMDNDIGTDLGGTVKVPNLADGVSLTDAPGTTIGEAGDANVISGNKLSGVVVVGAQSVGVVIQDNRIGLTEVFDTTQEEIVPNGLAGVAIVGDANGSGPIDTLVTGNFISGNSMGGIRLSGSGVTGTTITANVIGGGSIDPTSNFGNVDSGILILNSPGNTIGGTTTGSGNTIEFTSAASAPNEDYGTGNGLVIAGAGSTGNYVLGNIVTQNSQEGIVLAEGAAQNYVGTSADASQAATGTPTTGGNVITNNGADGVELIDTGTKNNIVASNLIGIDQNGNADGNQGDGVDIENGAANNLIGSVVAGSGNFIAASPDDGIFIGTQSPANTVAGNDIGTNRQGASAAGFGNTGAGIEIMDSPNNTVGGAVYPAGTAPGNVIMGNGQGIAILGSASSGNSLLGNVIANSQGFETEGDPTPSPGYGVLIDDYASNNQIGGPDPVDANSISSNAAAGVFVNSGTGDSIRNNFFEQNGGLGIDLAPTGQNPNLPPLQSGSGPNNLQNYPVFTWATVTPDGMGAIVGTLESSASTTYTLDFYAGPTAQGDDIEQILVARTVTTNASGIAEFDFPLPADTVQAGTIIRATATDPFGNTSELSDPVTVQVDSDGDGVPDALEAAGGEDPKTPGVVTVPDALNANAYFTLAAPQGVLFSERALRREPVARRRTGPDGVRLGFSRLRPDGASVGQHVAIQMTLPATVQAATSYWRYGPTPTNPSPHWYNWLYNPQTDTGARLNGNTITLHFVDGGLGDDDLTANGTIEDAGGPGFPSPYTVTTTADSGPGSLRQAITNANANPGMGDITFDIPGPGPYLIQPLSPLPAITAADDHRRTGGAAQRFWRRGRPHSAGRRPRRQPGRSRSRRADVRRVRRNDPGPRDRALLGRRHPDRV